MGEQFSQLHYSQHGIRKVARETKVRATVANSKQWHGRSVMQSCFEFHAVSQFDSIARLPRVQRPLRNQQHRCNVIERVCFVL